MTHDINTNLSKGDIILFYLISKCVSIRKERHLNFLLSPGKYVTPSECLTLDGCSLTPEDLVALGTGGLKIRVSKLTWEIS